MSGITLSASVRQNLLSLQSTSQLLATTQERLATGNKVNSALDNPTNFFTAQSLNNRASDISNLLDSIGNGVQVLQAANTGITSLQKLIDSAKSVANQALQATSGYSTKSQVVSTAISGATATNLLGTASYSDVAATAGSVVTNNNTTAPYNQVLTGSTVSDDHITGTFDGDDLAVNSTAAAIASTKDIHTGLLSANGFANGDSMAITVGGVTKTIAFTTTAANAGVVGDTTTLDLATADATALATAINTAFNGTPATTDDIVNASVNATTGALDITTATSSPTALTDSIQIGLSANLGSSLGFGATTVTRTPTPTAAPPADTSWVAKSTMANGLGASGGGAGFVNGDNFTIQVGSTTKTFEFNDGTVAGSNVKIGITGGTVDDVVNAINTAFGKNIASVDAASGSLKLSLVDGNNPVTVTTNANGGTTTAAAMGTKLGVGTSATTQTILASDVKLVTSSATDGGISGLAAGDTLTVNGKTLTFVDPTAPGAATSFNPLTGGTIKLDGSLQDVLDGINSLAGGTVASIQGGHLNIDATKAPAGTDVSISASASVKTALGLSDIPATITNTGGAASTTGITRASKLNDGGPTADSTGLANALKNGESITVNGKAINFVTGGAAGVASTHEADGSWTINLDNATVGDLLDTIDKITGTYGTPNASSVVNGQIKLSTGASALTLSDSTSAAATGNNRGVLAKLGLDDLDGAAAGTSSTAPKYASATQTLEPNTSAPAPIDGSTKLDAAAGPAANGLQSAFTASDTIVVNGKTISFSSTASSTTSDANGAVISLGSGTVQDVLNAIDKITGTYDATTGHGASTISGGQITLHTGANAQLDISGSGLAKLGLNAGVTKGQANNTLNGLTLDIASTDGGTATHITFGSGTGEVDTLDELNTALAANNLEASLDTTGKLTISTTNDHSSATVGTISGTAVSYAGSPFYNMQAAGPVESTDSQNSRAALVTQYNNIIDQLKTTAQDASFNGVNLLNGDQLKLVFNETGTSTLNIKGVTDDPSGLGLSYLTAGTDFLDNAMTNKILSSLNSASTVLRSQASTLGSNLSIVQIRQDFSNNLINVLQTGASNLTLADTNEEAANSQALSTRQSIAVSALALANQSQQSVLRLLQ